MFSIFYMGYNIGVSLLRHHFLMRMQFSNSARHASGGALRIPIVTHTKVLNEEYDMRLKQCKLHMRKSCWS